MEFWHTSWQKDAAARKKVATSHQGEVSVSAFLGIRRCKKLLSKISLLKISNYQNVCYVRFSHSTEGLIPDLSPGLLSAGIEDQQLQWLTT